MNQRYTVRLGREFYLSLEHDDSRLDSSIRSYAEYFFYNICTVRYMYVSTGTQSANSMTNNQTRHLCC